MERQPKLSNKQLPHDRLVTRDGPLRGASAEEVVGAVRTRLANERPSYRGVTVTLAADEAAISRVEARWRRLCRRNGIPEERASIVRSDRATTFFGEIVLLPDTVKDLAALKMMQRARGASTLAHEWWHASRRSGPSVRNFEEGAADAFAHEALSRAFGLTGPRAWQAYATLCDAIDVIGADLDLSNWYVPSRTTPDIPRWLRTTLATARYDLKSIEEVLMYPVSENDWLVRVRRMISGRRIP